MTQNINYQRGYGWVDSTTGAPQALNAAQQAQLRADLTAALNADPSTPGLGKAIYSDLLSWIAPGGTPLPGVDPDVYFWIAGAIEVNSGSGFNSDLIRDYTDDIHRIREGGNPATNLQQASNNIAFSLAYDILNNGGTIPGITGLGIDDAGGVASTVFVGSDAPQGVYSPWAGTLLFPFLGSPIFYENWLLNMNTVGGTVTNPSTNTPIQVTFKSIDGTYDLIASTEAFQQTAVALAVSYPFASVAANLQKDLGISVPDPDQSALQTEITNFFYGAYDLSSNQAPAIGGYTAFNLAPISTSVHFVAGSINNDSLTLSTGINIVNAGPGDDVISVPRGAAANIIDGGDGANSADYLLSGPVIFTLEQPNTPYFSYRIEVQNAAGTSVGPSDFLYNIQTVLGSSSGNTLDIPTLTPSSWTTIGQLPTFNLGASSNNVITLDGTGSNGGDIFSISQGSSPNDLLVSAFGSAGAAVTTSSIATSTSVSATTQASTANGIIDVTNPDAVLVKANSGDVVQLNDGLARNLNQIGASGFQVTVNSLQSTIKEIVSEQTGGSVTYTDMFGNPIVSYPVSEMTDGTVTISGNTISADNGSGLLDNTTQYLSLGGLSGVLDQTDGPSGPYKFTTLAFPGNPTFSNLTISDTGQLAGSFTQKTGSTSYNYSFLSPDTSGKLISYVAAPNSGLQGYPVNASTTYVEGINNGGTVVGNVTYGGNPSGVIYDGTGYSFGPAAGIWGNANDSDINNNGVIVGWSSSGFTYYAGEYGTYGFGFINDNGNVTQIEYPLTGQSTLQNDVNNLLEHTYPTGINDGGTVVGYYYNPIYINDVYEGVYPADGFIYRNGTYTQIDDPNGAKGTFPVAITNGEQVFGNYTDSKGVSHAFVDSSGTYTTIYGPNGSDIKITGANNEGDIVGVDSLGGFEAVPATSTRVVTSSNFYASGSGAVDLVSLNLDGTAANISLSSGARVTLTNGSLAAGAVIDLGSTGTASLIIGSGADIHQALVSGLTPGAAIGFADQQVATASFSPTTQMITLAGGSGASTSFRATGDQLAGITVVNGQAVIPCFAAGTHILTNNGEMRVEDLREGDLLLTTDGKTKPIIWIGQRRLNIDKHPDPDAVIPIKIARNAFGENIPHRDLFVSPDHAFYFDGVSGGVLVPAKLLVNGMSIKQAPIQEVTYYHVELPEHDVILAEGAKTESYLDTGDRENFSNSPNGTIRLHPDFSPKPSVANTWEMKGCAALVTTGPQLDAIHQKLSDRARIALPPAGRRAPIRTRRATAGLG